jgi:hypothetical protein
MLPSVSGDQELLQPINVSIMAMTATTLLVAVKNEQDLCCIFPPTVNGMSENYSSNNLSG